MAVSSLICSQATKLLRMALTLCLFAAMCSPSRAQAGQPAPAVSDAKTQQKARLKAFREQMMRIPHPAGCLKAVYPVARWEVVPCGPRSTKPNAFSVGNGTDSLAQASGGLTEAEGSFDSVTGASFGLTPASPAPVINNPYSLQINTNKFLTAACNNSNCRGWQQFIFSTTQCGGYACIFIEYWLFNTKSCPPPPWRYSNGGGKGAPGCFLNGQPASIPLQDALDLSQIIFGGSSDLFGGPNTSAKQNLVTFQSLNDPNLYAASDSDNQVTAQWGLGNNWTATEFNIFGDCCGSNVNLSNGTSLYVGLALFAAPPTSASCVNTGFSGFTAETNNLYLLRSCKVTYISTGQAGAALIPSIHFIEENSFPGTFGNQASAPGNSVRPPSFPLYCKVPISELEPGEFHFTLPFRWAQQSASQSPPGAGQCAWANRTPQGAELQAGGNSLFSQGIQPDLGKFTGFFKVCVYRDPNTNNLDIGSGPVAANPPFSANATGCP